MRRRQFGAANMCPLYQKSAHPQGELSRLRPAQPTATMGLSNDNGRSPAPRNVSLLTSSWSVQVGAFRNRGDARQQLERVNERFERQLRGSTGVIAGFTDGMFRARFVGLDQDTAQSACSALQARNVACMVIAPS